jgi:hypothetical protein
MTTWYEAMEADKVYKALLEDLQQCHNDIGKLRNKTRALIRDIGCLDTLEDLSLKSQWGEETSAEEDETLENITGIDGESWYMKHHRGQELCHELMVAKCVEVANIKATMDAVEERKDNVILEKDRYREQFQANYQKEQAN